MITCIKFGKEKDGAYVSHLDLIRVFERTFRRAKLPLSFSQGFSPRPKMVFAHALSLGMTSSGEYLDVSLEKELDPDQLLNTLKELMPEGFPIYELKNLDDRVKPIMAAITHASYLFMTDLDDRSQEAKLTAQFLEAKRLDKLLYTKERKGKLVTRDLRPLITSIEPIDKGVRAVVRAGSEENLRPDDLLNALGIDISVTVHREDLYIEKDGKLISPLMRS